MTNIFRRAGRIVSTFLALACGFKPAVVYSQAAYRPQIWHRYNNAIFDSWKNYPQEKIPKYAGKGTIGGQVVTFQMSIQPVAYSVALQCLGLVRINGGGKAFVPMFIFSDERGDYYIDRIPFASPYANVADESKVSADAGRYYIIGGGFFAPGFEFLYDFENPPRQRPGPEYVRRLPKPERIATRAGSFDCSHYLIHRLDRDVDVWFSPLVPGGVIKIISRNRDQSGIARSRLGLEAYENRVRPHVMYLQGVMNHGIDDPHTRVDGWYSDRKGAGNPKLLRTPILGGEFSAVLTGIVDPAQPFPANFRRERAVSNQPVRRTSAG
ncbi:MAG TPA: hypothetical protein VGO11_26125 [Chthoniobacteraceae bacterium]|jgi:hypothetical protein|nr:hypothetical protein [Chthoniobacteraceae bacterium]